MRQRKPETIAERVGRPLDYSRIIRDSRDLTSSERLVALAHMTHAGANGRDSHPGTKLLMAETDLAENTVNRANAGLVEKKYLIQTYSGRGGRHDRANAYDLSRPVVPNLNGCGLRDDPKPQSEGSQTSTDAVPNLTGGVTDALSQMPLENCPHHHLMVTRCLRRVPQL